MEINLDGIIYNGTNAFTGFTPVALSTTARKAFLRLGFKREYTSILTYGNISPNVSDVLNGFIFIDGSAFLLSCNIDGKEYITCVEEKCFYKRVQFPPEWKPIVLAIVIFEPSSLGDETEPSEPIEVPLVLYNKEKNALIFLMAPNQANKLKIIKKAIEKTLEYFKDNLKIAEKERKKIQDSLKELKGLMPDTQEARKHIGRLKRAIKTIEGINKEEIEEAKIEGSQKATEAFKIAIETEKEEVRKIKARYEDSVLMPNITREDLKKKVVVFKEKDELYIGKKINITPIRFSNGSRLPGKIEYPVEAIKGYLCAKSHRGHILGATMVKISFARWTHSLYHIYKDGDICLGDCGRDLERIDPTDIQAVVRWLEKVEEMMMLINVKSVYSMDSLYHKAIFRKWYLKSHPDKQGRSKLDSTIEKYIERGYVMGSFYKGKLDTKKISLPSEYRELDGLDEYGGDE